MQIKINSLNLQNFQGIGKMDISFDDKATIISGRNGSGKSTIANAISWLLFDCASDRTKNYSPKTIGADGKELHNLHHSAEAVFSCDTDTFTLKKDLYEEYVVRRGVTDADGNKKREFTGHVCDYYIDGKQVKKEEYATSFLPCSHRKTPKSSLSPSTLQLKWTQKHEEKKS